jgi:hypothetical protein
VQGVNIFENPIEMFHGYAGILTGYTEFDILLLLIFLFAIGILIGTSSSSFLSSITTSFTFIGIHFLLFFGIGLLYLGHHYEYDEMFSNVMITLVFPFVILCFGSGIGSLAIKKTPKYISHISQFNN